MSDLPTETLIPRGAVLQHIINGYGPLADSVPCGLENCRQFHQRGFVVAFSCEGAESVGAIGHVCARNLFGESWTGAKKAYTASVNAAALAARARSLAPSIEIVLPQVRAAIPRLRLFQDIRTAMQKSVPLFFRACAEAVRTRRGYLGIDTREGFKPMALVEGGGFYLKEPPYYAALVLKEELERFPAFLAHKDATPRGIEKRVSELGNIEHRWRSTIEAWLTAAERALRPEHLEPLCAFSTEHKLDAIRLSVNKKKLLCMGFRSDTFEHGWVELCRLDVIRTGPQGSKQPIGFIDRT
jgi:hypothetical protein